jgi:hypothetical protein
VSGGAGGRAGLRSETWAHGLLRGLLVLLPGRLRRRRGEMAALLRELLAEAHHRGGAAAVWRAAAREAADLVATSVRLRPALGVTAASGALLLAALVLRAGWGAVGGPVGGGATAGAAGDVAYGELVVEAVDPAGHFTLTLRRGRLVAATLDDVPHPAHLLEQEGGQIRLLDPDGAILLAVRFTAPGRIAWVPRPSQEAR